MNATIRQRLGDSSLEAMVERLYALAITDQRTRDFFDHPANTGSIIERRRKFSRMALGAASGAVDWDLRKIHAPLIKRGLDDRHFDAFMEHLASTPGGAECDG